MSTSTPLSRLQELLPELFQTQQLPGKPYLRFQLTAEITALFPIEQVKESLLVEEQQVTPLPNLPAPVMGMMSSRNYVFCVIDLAQLLMLPPVAMSDQRYHVVVVRVSQSSSQPGAELLLGIAVERILGITRLTSEKLQSPIADFPASLTPYLRGAVIDGNKQTLVLDVSSIVGATCNLV